MTDGGHTMEQAWAMQRQAWKARGIDSDNPPPNCIASATYDGRDEAPCEPICPGCLLKQIDRMMLDDLVAELPVLAAAIHEAARIEQIMRDNGLMMVDGVVYGDEGRRGMVTLAAHTQALAQLRHAQSELEAWRSCCAVPLFVPSPHRGEGQGEGETVEAADR